MTKDLVLIGGGVGPMAGVALHRKVIENTDNEGTDQGHLEVLHLSRSPIIGDRTEFLLGRDVQDPVTGMLRVFRMAAAALSSESRGGVGGVPCNTFHAPPIYERFEGAFEAEGLPIRLLHMLRETAQMIATVRPGARRVGVLSTTGTRSAGVYRTLFAEEGLDVTEIPEEHQGELHEAIYHREWGLKALSAADPRAAERVTRFADMLIDDGAEVLILGCTELPFALDEGSRRGVPVIDPMTALARALVREVAPRKLKPLGS
ncbi:MAG: aspartate/glutamate racemase family protein [Spirochaetaceae bacterium]